MISELNKRLLAAGKSPVVDLDWIKTYPEDAHRLGEKIDLVELGEIGHLEESDNALVDDVELFDV